MEFISSTQMNITMTEQVIGLSKNQDFTVTGQGSLNGKLFDYGVLLDGHGTNTFINLMRQQDWLSIMSQEDPWDALYIILKTIRFQKIRGSFESSGSTLLMMRAFEDRIETISVGDSQIVIFKNDEYVYGTTPHNRKNPLEVERLPNHPYYSYSKKSNNIPAIKSATSLRAITSEYNYFVHTMLAMTQSIGHNDITGYEPERKTIFFDANDKMDVIMGSDGLWEMILLDDGRHPISEEDMPDVLQDKQDLLTMNAAELASKSEARWKKTDWKYYWSLNSLEKFIINGFDGSYDDISAIKWTRDVASVKPLSENVSHEDSAVNGGK
jgi:serine/threonine protein phosphatase PrpC